MKTQVTYIKFNGETCFSEKNFEFLDARGFLEDFWKYILENNISVDSETISVNKEVLKLFDYQYSIFDSKKDLIDSFTQINEEDIKDQESLLEVVKQAKKLKQSLTQYNLTKLEQRQICMAFFNDPKLISKIDSKNLTELKKIEHKSKQTLFRIYFLLKNLEKNGHKIAKDLNNSDIITNVDCFNDLTSKLVETKTKQETIKRLLMSNRFIIPITKEDMKKQKIKLLDRIINQKIISRPNILKK